MNALRAAAAALSLCLAAPALAQQTSFAQVERGKYITATANCQGCHTLPGQQAFTGGRGLETPFGVIYTPNITFDEETGLGRWSKDDFWGAMHNGVAPDGSRLYPAFPYPHFTKMPRADVDSVYDYLASLPRARRPKPDNELLFPLGWRRLVAGWNMMFFTPGAFQPDPQKSAQWNRGAYLVEGPGHCAGCHTEKNLAGADKESRHLRGGVLEHWAAPGIRAGRNGGIAHWSEDDFVEFLKTGRNVHTAAVSTMSEVIEYSTQHMTDDDLRAIHVYLKSLDNEPRPEPAKPAEAVMKAGGAIYFDNCSACHASKGQGAPRFFAPLAGSNKVNNEDPTTVIRMILQGARAVPTKTRPSPLSMPAFDWKLTDAQVASVATYIRASWGNSAEPVTEREVRNLRRALKPGPS